MADKAIGYLSSKIHPRVIIAIGLPVVGVTLILSSFMPNIYLCAAVLGVGGLGLGMCKSKQKQQETTNKKNHIYLKYI